MISKELLSEVLDIKYSFKNIKLREYEPYIQWYCDEVYKEHVYSINVYELAHKCKEWALTKHKISLQSTPIEENENEIYWSVILKLFNEEYEENLEHIIKDTEPEAIFKACQWVLENKDIR